MFQLIVQIYSLCALLMQNYPLVGTNEMDLCNFPISVDSAHFEEIYHPISVLLKMTCGSVIAGSC